MSIHTFSRLGASFHPEFQASKQMSFKIVCLLFKHVYIYLRIENAEGYVLIAVYLFIYLFSSVQFICIAQFHKLQICLGVLYNLYT